VTPAKGLAPESRTPRTSNFLLILAACMSMLGASCDRAPGSDRAASLAGLEVVHIRHLEEPWWFWRREVHALLRVPRGWLPSASAGDRVWIEFVRDGSDLRPAALSEVRPMSATAEVRCFAPARVERYSDTNLIALTIDGFPIRSTLSQWRALRFEKHRKKTLSVSFEILPGGALQPLAITAIASAPGVPIAPK